MQTSDWVTMTLGVFSLMVAFAAYRRSGHGLRQAQRSADAAERSAFSSETSAQQAIKNVELAQEALETSRQDAVERYRLDRLEREPRLVLAVTDARYSKPDPRVLWSITNVGKSVAREIQLVAAHVNFSPIDDRWSPWPLGELGPGEVLEGSTRSWNCEELPEEYAAILQLSISWTDDWGEQKPVWLRADHRDPNRIGGGPFRR